MHDFKEALRKAVVWLLTLEAKAILKKYRPRVIAVTGSVGKTSAKDAVYAALSLRYFVRRSEKGYNSDIGVPLTILGVPNGGSNPIQWLKNLIDGLSIILLSAPYPEWLVLEIGGDRPGDISRSLSWLAPNVVVATRFPDIPVHVEFYDSPGAVLKEELSPLSWLTDQGLAIINADDARAMAEPLPSGVRRVTYGFSLDADVKASRFHLSSKNHMPSGMSFDINCRSERTHVSFENIVGKGHAYAVLAGISASVGLGAPLADAVNGVEKYDPPLGRSRVIPGVRKTSIIDDSYNASPVAVEEGLHALKEIPRLGKRLAVIGDMLELGVYSQREHERVGRYAAECADILITVGIRAKGIAAGARESGMPHESVIECERGSDASSVLISEVQEGDVIFVKGSQAMRMERVVKSVMQRPELAPQLLVRQEPEWLSRS
jgi:UDP-N-acetylmuramoyl-tripeptide--D-alanyl-D-alanine ligase